MSILKRTAQTILVCLLVVGLLWVPASAFAEDGPIGYDQPAGTQEIDSAETIDESNSID